MWNLHYTETRGRHFHRRDTEAQRNASRLVLCVSASLRRIESFSMDERRTLRVSEAVREELSEIIGFETDDPRLLAVDVVEVHVSADGRHANVRVAVRGDEREQRESLAALEHARAYLRHELAMRLSLRHVPELQFDHDRNPDVESRIDFPFKQWAPSPYERLHTPGSPPPGPVGVTGRWALRPRRTRTREGPRSPTATSGAGDSSWSGSLSLTAPSSKLPLRVY